MEDFNINRAVKSWFVIIGLSFFIIIGSMAVHEIGHAIVGVAAGCSVESIVLYGQGSNPTTSIKCNDDFNNVIVSLAGMAFNVLFGIVFLFSDKRILNNAAYMFFGFALYSGKMDLQSIGFPALISSLISLIGVGIIIYSLYLLCRIEISDLFKTKELSKVVTS